MELNTAAQRSTVPAYSAMPVKQEPTLPAPAEYGCVDWYPYMSALEHPADRFDQNAAPTLLIG